VFIMRPTDLIGRIAGIACPSVRLYVCLVCLVGFLNRKQNCIKGKICVNVPRARDDRCVNFMFKMSKVKVMDFISVRK